MAGPAGAPALSRKHDAHHPYEAQEPTVKYDPVKNPNYVATVVAVAADDLRPLAGLDNLVAFSKFGMQALVSRDTAPGLYILFSTEVQLAAEFARANNLFRDGLSNADPRKTGYLEQNRRVKAIKLRGHRSESLLMPLDSLAYLLSARDLAAVREGDVFDSIDGHEVCRKYVVREPRQNAAGTARPRVRRVDAKVFPEHADSESYFRNAHKVPQGAPVVVTQKLHGTSVRYGNVPALADRAWWQRLLRRPARTPHRFVVGSRRLVKSVDLVGDDGGAHHYGSDLWTDYAAENRLADLIPRDHVVYGELVGWAGPGSPIQRGYTYDVPDGTARLYVYRVAVVTPDGHSVDYSPEQMETFCADRGLAVVPVLWTGLHADFVVAEWLDRRYHDEWSRGAAGFVRTPVPLPAGKAVDEGVCVRYDGPYGPYIVKAKAPAFLVFESKALDAGAEDVEATEAEAGTA